jgi:hypothetical protein
MMHKPWESSSYGLGLWALRLSLLPGNLVSVLVRHMFSVHGIAGRPGPDSHNDTLLSLAQPSCHGGYGEIWPLLTNVVLIIICVRSVENLAFNLAALHI